MFVQKKMEITQAVEVIEEFIDDIKIDARALNVLNPRHNAYWLLKELAKMKILTIEFDDIHSLEILKNSDNEKGTLRDIEVLKKFNEEHG